MGRYEDNNNISYIGDKDVLGGLPVVEQTQAFIAAFKGVVSSTPEQIANSSFFITYLINEAGEVFQVSEDSDAQRDILQNFAVGDDVIVRVDQGTLINTQLAGEHKVTGIGSFVPIFVTQTGSSDNAFVPFVNFQNPGEEAPDAEPSTVPSFLAKAFISSSTTNTIPSAYDDTAGVTLDVSNTSGVPLTNYAFRIASGALNTGARTFVGEQFNGSTINTWYTGSSPDLSAASWSMFDQGGDSFAETGSYVLADPKPTFNNITFRVSWGLYNFRFNTATAEIALFKNEGGTYTKLKSATTNLGPLTNVANAYATAELFTGTNEFVVTTNEINEADEIIAVVSSENIIDLWADNTLLDTQNGYAGASLQDGIALAATNEILEDGSEVNIPQLTLEVTAQSPGTTVTTPQPAYFTSGSSVSTVITASSVLTSEYGNFQALPTSSADFGFSPINFPFTVKPGDKMRFGYNNDNVFTVFKVEEPPISPLLYLTLDRAIGGNLNLKNVVLYRNLEDGKFLTLSVNKNDPQFSEVDFTGIIIPRFASPGLKKNANEIVSRLKSEGILTED
jgi:hypothetical protein